MTSAIRSVRMPPCGVLADAPPADGGLVARSRELAGIDQLLGDARLGRAGALGLHGESGVGKSALIEVALARASELHTVQVRGPSAPRTPDALADWPDPLHELASRIGPADVARAPLGHRSAAVSRPAIEAAAAALRRMAGERGAPLLVTLDDCQTLPAALVIALAAAVVARLRDEPLALLLAWRDTPHLAGFRLPLEQVPVHRLGGLTLGQSRELVASRCDHLPAEPVLVELVQRTGGNPVALLSACARLSAAQLAGWHPLPDPLPIGDSSTEAFDVVRHLPAPTRRALAVVAPGGVPSGALDEALHRLGVSAGDLDPAVEAGVVSRRGARIDYAHPLVRSAAFYRAPPEVRQAVRRVLSDVLADAQDLEASAYQASIDVAGPDAVAERRLVEAAAAALRRGAPAAAARYEELAARCAASGDTQVEHLAGAAGHWEAAGEVARARYCLEAAATPRADAGARAPAAGRARAPDAGRARAPVAGRARAELDYQLARLSGGAEDARAPERMVEAAEACALERPQRAVSMLLDAAAWRLLEDEPGAAEQVASRAVGLAGAMSSHSEVLARAVRTAAVVAAGGKADDIGDRGHVSLLVGQAERFPASSEVAFVIGMGLLHQGLHRQAERWAQWIARCAGRAGEVPLAGVAPLLEGMRRLFEGDLAAATVLVESHPMAPGSAEHMPLDAWSWHLAASVHTMAGRYEPAMAAAAQLFSCPGPFAARARLRTFPVLALLELQRERRDAAVAWARTFENDLGLAADPRRLLPVTLAEVAPLAATVLLLARCDGGDAWGREQPALARWCRAWLEGAGETADPLQAAARLDEAAVALQDRPLLQILAELCRGRRMADAGLVGEAAARLVEIERRATAAGASGLATLAASERHALAESSAPVGARWPAPRPEWEISLLGGFCVRRSGEPISLPASLAAQAVKIVALRRRLGVDELTELLWEEAEPRVGSRRLRNVLWRIRAACGDLVVREDGFVRLAPGATTDLERFRSMADQALVGPAAGTSGRVELARAALDWYGGELLPGDRYADWSAPAREAATRTCVRLLELLVDDALGGGRQAEALVLLDRLAEADPYDERHHLRAAEIHLDAGNRSRALHAVQRAERMLADLDLVPTDAILRLKERAERA